MSSSAIQKKKLSGATKKEMPTVLAVDDQPTCLSILKLLVEGQGATVETAQDGEEALAIWKQKQHQLIITDCNMPNMDGFSLAKAIRHTEQVNKSHKSTIVALSSNNAKEEAQLCISAGMDYVLSKPVDRTQIETLLSQWRSHHTISQTINSSSVNLQSSQAPIDYSVLTSVFPEAAKHQAILEKLHKHLQEDFQALELEVELANFLGVERLAHRMKGACKMVGANDIATVCEEVENNAKKGASIQDDVITALGQKVDELDAYVSLQVQANAHNQLQTVDNAST